MVAGNKLEHTMEKRQEHGIAKVQPVALPCDKTPGLHLLPELSSIRLHTGSAW